MTQKPIDTDLVGITFNARSAIAQELKKRALERGVTQRCILHEGLKLLGFDVQEDDLQDRRGRPAKADQPGVDQSGVDQSGEAA